MFGDLWKYLTTSDPVEVPEIKVSQIEEIYVINVISEHHNPEKYFHATLHVRIGTSITRFPFLQIPIVDFIRLLMELNIRMDIVRDYFTNGSLDEIVECIEALHSGTPIVNPKVKIVFPESLSIKLDDDLRDILETHIESFSVEIETLKKNIGVVKEFVRDITV